MKYGSSYRLVFLVACCVAMLGVVVDSAVAAGKPEIVSSGVTGVSATATDLRAQINAEGSSTTYRFEYISAAAYQANLTAVPARAGFGGASKAPPNGAGILGSATTPVLVVQHVNGLTAATSYRYRVLATNSEGAAAGVERTFSTQDPTNVSQLPDGRSWEMVSPLDKEGGAIQSPGRIVAGGVFQAAADGDSFTYSSADSFGTGGEGAPAGSQYIASRAVAGWSSANITTPLFSGSYGNDPDGVPYQLFSPGLSTGLLANGERCRGNVGGPCPVVNPPLPGSGAPAGYRNYYLRDSSGGFRALLGSTAITHTALGPQELELRFVAATPDLAHILLSSCAALTANATELAAPGGCDSAAQNLYEWSGTGLTLINLLPGDVVGTPGASVAAPAGAISADGSRVYWSEGGDLYLRDGTQTQRVDEGSGGGGVFQTASADGAVAFFTAAGHLYRFKAASATIADLTPGGEVEGVLGASADGSRVYYMTPAAIFLRAGVATSEVAAASGTEIAPPAIGTARVSADGLHLLFLSSAELTGYDSRGGDEVFLYGPAPGDATAGLVCVSCNPSGELPEGPASIPGAVANGAGAGATDIYRPRVLSSDGERVFFDSADSLVSQDSNKQVDTYEWEARGTGGCGREGGCVSLISGGRSPNPSTFVDADEDGSNVFFLTTDSLFLSDPGSYDVYDARVGGGFAAPLNAIPCNGDACQVLPEAPEDPTPGTLVPNSGNPPLTISRSKAAKKRTKHKKKNKKGAGRRGRR